ncbi:MAG: hypothetical protein JWL66_2563 [Sphingomonadales bacterium]|nr:hypothetical protein [Sphingomonadales bacterium]
MHNDLEKAGIWCGIVSAVLIFVGLGVFMHFIPPPSPATGAHEIGNFYREHSTGIRIGGILMLATSALFIPFYSVLSAHLQRMEPHGSPLAKAQLMIAALALFMPIAITAVLWIVAAYRVERSDETIQLLNDIGWMLFFTPVIAGLLQVFVVAAAIFADVSPEPRFPRWFAFYSIWIGILFLPAGLLPMFKTGWLAWDGILAFWLGITAFGIWFIPMAVLLLKACDRATIRERAA